MVALFHESCAPITSKLLLVPDSVISLTGSIEPQACGIAVRAGERQHAGAERLRLIRFASRMHTILLETPSSSVSAKGRM